MKKNKSLRRSSRQTSEESIVLARRRRVKRDVPRENLGVAYATYPSSVSERSTRCNVTDANRLENYRDGD